MITATSQAPLRIAIDGNEANVKNRVGSNVYAWQIISALEKVTYKLPQFQITVLLSEKKLPDLPRRRKNWDYQILTPKKFWTQWALPLYLQMHRQDYDVFYTPGHYAPRICPIPYVSSVMDLAFLKYPQQFKKKDYLQLKEWTNYSVKNATKIVTISEFSKHEITEAYGRDPQDIVVAYPAVEPPQPQTTSQRRIIKHKLKLPDHFILYVGTIQPRKNLQRLIKAFEKLCFFIDKENFNDNYALRKRGRKTKLSSLADIKLVIVGKIGWLAQPIIDQINNSPFKDRIVMTGYVQEKVKQILINQASVLTLIGFYEGFGIPALEAMQLKTVPVVSQTSSLREVVGAAGILVDPHDVDSITLGLKEALSLSTKQKAILYKNARQQLAKFDWQTSAQTILHTLQETIYSSGKKK